MDTPSNSLHNSDSNNDNSDAEDDPSLKQEVKRREVNSHGPNEDEHDEEDNPVRDDNPLQEEMVEDSEVNSHDPNEDDPDNPPEQEIKIFEVNVIGCILEVKIYFQKAAEVLPWLKPFLVICTKKDFGTQIGRGVGMFIDRNQGGLRSDFRGEMDQWNATGVLGVALFDRYGTTLILSPLLSSTIISIYHAIWDIDMSTDQTLTGRVRREFVDHVIRKGTGSWGHELDNGYILLIGHIRVLAGWRAVLDFINRHNGQ